MFFLRTLMLVDDQVADRMALTEAVRNTGYQVVAQINNTDEALDKVEHVRPDAVIMDVTLPGYLDSLVAIQRMRRRHPEIAILATGTISQAPLLMEALTMGACEFLTKPYQRRSVQLALQRAIG